MIPHKTNNKDRKIIVPIGIEQRKSYLHLLTEDRPNFKNLATPFENISEVRLITINEVQKALTCVENNKSLWTFYQGFKGNEVTHEWKEAYRSSSSCGQYEKTKTITNYKELHTVFFDLKKAYDTARVTLL